MIEIKDMREMHLEKKIWVMIMNGLKEGIVMIEKRAENDLVIVTVNDLETVIVTAKGITVSVTGTKKIGTGMQIITGTETGKQNTMMSGRGDDHQSLTVSHGYRKRRNTILGQEMLIMGRGGGLPLNNYVCWLLFL